MSTLTNVAVPVISLSPQCTSGGAQLEQSGTRNSYGDRPILVKPSSHAPRQARIVSRVAELGVPVYLLQIGDVLVHDVRIDEILDYVSPRELEEFETRQFEEENEIIKIDEAIKEVEREAAREHAKERAKRKGVVLYEERDDESSTDEAVILDVPLGKHGRARPSYTHLYKAPERRRRRKRDTATGELKTLSDVETDSATGDASSQDEMPAKSAYPSRSSSPEHPKRRRRRRDKLTGELLPLSPEEQARSKVLPPAEQPCSSSDYVKRPRRRRHPITKQLMPLGWRYDPEAESKALRRKDVGTDISALPTSQGEHIKDAHYIKRLRLAPNAMEPSSIVQSSWNIDDISQSDNVLKTATENSVHITPEKEDPDCQSSKKPEKDRPEGPLQHFIANSQTKFHHLVGRTAQLAGKPSSEPPPDQLTLASFLARHSKMNHSSPSSSTTPESVNEMQILPKTNLIQSPASTMSSNKTMTARKKTSIPYQEQRSQRTSIMNPVASGNSVDDVINLESEDEVVNEGEWFVEAILDHQLSDPRTHPPDLGSRPIMLYCTKWQGFAEPTWEPAESFIDSEILDDYRKNTGLKPRVTSRNDKSVGVNQVSASGDIVAPNRQSKASASNKKIDQDEDTPVEEEEEEDDYEIEAILAHQLSDPKTHSKGLGKQPVMLYLVKWVGFESPTWEPVDSFSDRGIIEEYEGRIEKPKSMR